MENTLATEVIIDLKNKLCELDGDIKKLYEDVSVSRSTVRSINDGFIMGTVENPKACMDGICTIVEAIFADTEKIKKKIDKYVGEWK